MTKYLSLLLKITIFICAIFIYGCSSIGDTPKYDNLSFGIPGKADTIIDRPGYALGYSEYHEQPAWVIYIMTQTEATTNAAKRTDKFRSDPQIPTKSATPSYIDDQFAKIYEQIVRIGVNEDEVLNYYWRSRSPDGYNVKKHWMI